MLYKSKKESSLKSKTIEAYHVGVGEPEPDWMNDSLLIEKINNHKYNINIYMDDWETAQKGDYIIKCDDIVSLWKEESFENNWILVSSDISIVSSDISNKNTNLEDLDEYNELISISLHVKQCMLSIDKKIEDLINRCNKNLENRKDD